MQNARNVCHASRWKFRPPPKKTVTRISFLEPLDFTGFPGTFPFFFFCAFLTIFFRIFVTYSKLISEHYEMYSDKLSISVVNLNQIELATEEDRKYGIDHWARLFKATTWEAIKLLAKENEYISSAAETMYESSQDKSMRFFLEGVEEANRIRRGQEIRLERAAEELQAKENRIAQMNDTLAKLDASLAEKAVALAEKDSALAEKDAEIARLKEQLAALTK